MSLEVNLDKTIEGKLPSLPKYTSRIVLNQIKPLCSVYHELATAFTNFDSDKLSILCQKYHNSLEADGNIGLVKLLQQAFYKNNIKKLTKTYITLSLSDMALKVKLPSANEAETYMRNMIKDGEIFATINQKDGVNKSLLVRLFEG
jgi:COP9 signalosome complex subunit 3